MRTDNETQVYHLQLKSDLSWKAAESRTARCWQTEVTSAGPAKRPHLKRHQWGLYEVWLVCLPATKPLLRTRAFWWGYAGDNWATHVVQIKDLHTRISRLGKHDSFQKCKCLTGCSLLHTITAPPVWGNSASSTFSCYLFMQTFHCTGSQKSWSYRNNMRLCFYTAIGIRGCICFPQTSQRMLLRIQCLSRDNRKTYFYFLKTWFMQNLKSDLTNRGFLRAKQSPKNAFR